ncbi:MAG: hypothetical protein GY803_13200 [Chloroflexi bacterium]|nr:hypothetical protein [Chloroflexota bacterium]
MNTAGKGLRGSRRTHSVRNLAGLGKLIVLATAALLLWGCRLVTSPDTAILPTVMPTAELPTTVSQTALPPQPALPSPTPLPATAVPPTLPPTFTAVPPATFTLVPTQLPPNSNPAKIIGKSVQGRPLTAYRFGNGPDQIVFVGGIHGGYEWNTILLAYQAVDYFTLHPETVPISVTLHIIPSANPDGQFLATGRDGRFSPLDVAANSFPGRFNANNVDLNRNWECNWSETAVWRDQTISGGPFPFSEPENIVLRDFLLELNPITVIFWHSAANGVYAASCPDLYQPSYALASIYGRAAGYPVYENFDSYQVTGDAGDWLALQNIPAISVELINHEQLDWQKNLAGMTAVLNQYNQIAR